MYFRVSVYTVMYFKLFDLIFLLQVRTYSEWVIDGEYDWPPKCCQCHVVLEEGTDSQTTRLGCLRM